MFVLKGVGLSLHGNDLYPNNMAYILECLALLALYTGLATSNCPLHGCTLASSYVSEVQFLSQGREPSLSWSWKGEDGIGPSGDGCVTNGRRILCPVITDGGMSFLFSWGTADVDRKPWNVTFKGDVVLPTVDFSGDFIASDGLVLVGYGSTGTPFGEPITLFPVNGQLFDLTLVASKVVLLYKCGFLVTYLTTGVPVASIWLNDTVDGETGTFIPLSSPAAQGNRFYILTAFRAHSETSSQINLKLRLFAIDINNSAVLRISIAWRYDFTIANTSLPYLESSESMCTLRPPPEGVRANQNGRNSFVQVAVSGDNLVTVLFRYREPKMFVDPNLYNHSRMMIVEDTGKTFIVRFTGDTVNAFQALAFKDDSSYWTAFYYLQTKQSRIQQHMFPRGEMTADINIAQLLGVGSKQVNITSDLTFLNMDSSSPLVFCVLVENADSKLLAVDVSNEKLLWTVDLGSELCTGQISSIDGSKNSFLVVTTTSQLLVYSLN